MSTMPLTKKAPINRAELIARMEANARIQHAARTLPTEQREVLSGLRVMTWDTLATSLRGTTGTV